MEECECVSARSPLKTFASLDLDQPDAEVARDLDLIGRKWLVAKIRQIDAVRVDVVAEGLSTSIGEREGSPVSPRRQ
jgi:hypothetical protein